MDKFQDILMKVGVFAAEIVIFHQSRMHFRLLFHLLLLEQLVYYGQMLFVMIPRD